MNDIVERIRNLRYVHVPQASQLFEEAVSEIERLRLTDAEREAVAELTDDPDYYGLTRTHTKVLRGLLERTK